MPKDQDRSCRTGDVARMRASWVRLALGAGLAASVVCANTSSARAGEGDNSIYDEFLSVIGLGNNNGDVQYGERSPLVVPPTRDLPPPAADARPDVPDWPKDPDVVRAKRAKIKEKPGPHPDWATQLANPMRPSELNVPGAAPARSTGPNGISGADYPERIDRPKKSVFSLDWFKREQYATFTGEPQRSSLTDPPPGYLTPSPDQPYGVGPADKKYTVPNLADRAVPVSGSAGGGN